MDDIEELQAQFQNGLNTHNKLVESWSDGRDDIVKAISWRLLMLSFYLQLQSIYTSFPQTCKQEI